MGILRKNKKEDVKLTSEFTNPISNLIMPSGGSSGTVITDSEKLISTWLSEDLLPMKTNLDQNQINSICILKSLATQFKIKPLNDLIFNYIMFMISKGSQSANQLVDILQGRGLMDKDEMNLISRFSK